MPRREIKEPHNSYSEKLKHPLWQKKRLEIFQRDNFTCRICGSKDKTLNVHHFIYDSNSEPWEIDNNFLITLCDKCHKDESETRKDSESFLIDMLKGGFTHKFIYGLCDCLLFDDTISDLNKIIERAEILFQEILHGKNKIDQT